MVGRTIQHYRIVRQLGKGGMGVVYAADDLKLGRTVALKFLAPDRLGSAESLERLRLEARAASALNHENICTIFAVEDAGAEPFIVMELLDGNSLETLQYKARPVEQVLDIGIQVADALSAAHARNILHRDIKPANLFLTARERIKVLDFGVAKFVQPAAISATAATDAYTPRLTVTGSPVGTASYMSPEQARGEEIDARSDLFSLGCVLYQLACGQHPFEAPTPAAVYHAILDKAAPPPPSRLNPALPPKLDEIILKTLEKDRDLRTQSAAELRADLKRVQRQLSGAPATSTTATSVPVTIQPARNVMRARILIGLAAALLTVAVVVIVTRLTQTSRPPQVTLEPLTAFTDAALAPALSPDGRALVYLRTPAGSLGSSMQRFVQIYVQLLPNGEPQRLTSNAQNKDWPWFSPDGSRIAYTSADEHFVWDSWQVPLLGGAPAPLLRNASGLTWMPRGGVLYSKILEGVHMGIATARESRTDERMIYVPPGNSSMAHRSFLSPDGKWLLVVEMDNNGIWQPCRLLPFDGSSTGRAVGPLKAQCTAAGWSPDQRWMYVSSNAGGAFHLWRQRFPDGAPQQLTFGPTEEEGVSVAPDGKSLVTAVGTRQSTIWIHDARGDRQLSSRGYAMMPTLSPGDGWVYFVVRTQSAQSYTSGELWRVDLDGDHAEQVLPGVWLEGYSLSRDGRKLLYSTAGEQGEAGIWIAELDRRSPPKQLTRAGEYRAFFGAPGQIIFMSTAANHTGGRGYLMTMKEDGSDVRQLSTTPILYLMAVSSDGDWATVSTPVGHGEATNELRAVSLRDGKSVLLCDRCIAGFGPGRLSAPPFSFGPKGRSLYFSLQYAPERSSKTAVIPLHGAPFDLATGGPMTEDDLVKRLKARLIEQRDVFPGPDPSIYVYAVSAAQTNIYRVLLPD